MIDDGKYPNWQAVIPTKERRHELSIDIDDFWRWLTQRKRQAKLKKCDMSYNNAGTNITLQIDYLHEIEMGLKLEFVLQFILLARVLGNGKIYRNDTNTMLLYETDDKKPSYILCCAMNSRPDTSLDDVYYDNVYDLEAATTTTKNNPKQPKTTKNNQKQPAPVSQPADNRPELEFMSQSSRFRLYQKFNKAAKITNVQDYKNWRISAEAENPELWKPSVVKADYIFSKSEVCSNENLVYDSTYYQLAIVNEEARLYLLYDRPERHCSDEDYWKIATRHKPIFNVDGRDFYSRCAMFYLLTNKIGRVLKDEWLPYDYDPDGRKVQRGSYRHLEIDLSQYFEKQPADSDDEAKAKRLRLAKAKAKAAIAILELMKI